MNAHDRQVYVVEKLVMKLHRQARAEKHHDFFLTIPLQEREEHQKPLLGGTNNVACKKRMRNIFLASELVVYSEETMYLVPVPQQ